MPRIGSKKRLNCSGMSSFIIVHCNFGRLRLSLMFSYYGAERSTHVFHVNTVSRFGQSVTSFIKTLL